VCCSRRIATRPTERDLEQLAHELAVLTRLAGAPVAVALALEEKGGRTWLVLEDQGGEPLNRIAARFRAPTNALALGAKIVGALAEVHCRGVIHRDIKPHHVLVFDDESVQLTDFRSASLLRVDGAVTSMPGSPAYMAPEQTGRMNRPVDKRADPGFERARDPSTRSWFSWTTCSGPMGQPWAC